MRSMGVRSGGAASQSSSTFSVEGRGRLTSVSVAGDEQQEALLSPGSQQSSKALIFSGFLPDPVCLHTHSWIHMHGAFFSACTCNLQLLILCHCNTQQHSATYCNILQHTWLKSLKSLTAQPKITHVGGSVFAEAAAHCNKPAYLWLPRSLEHKGVLQSKGETDERISNETY